MNYKEQYHSLTKEQKKEFNASMKAVFKIESKQALYYHISKDRKSIKPLEHHFITNLFKKVKGE